MALVLADRVRETTTTAGSGTITLAGTEPGYQSFSAIGDGNQTYYVIAGDTEWEVGIGTYTASGTTLSRDTVLSSSASGAKVTFSAGTKRVFVSYPSEKSVNLDVSGNIVLSSAVISGVASPSADSDAATKLYVDTLAAQGITYHTPVKYEVPNTTGNLTATYNNGTAGVSATLTNAGTLAAFVPDGVTATISDRVLIYNQTNAFENGVYTVTVVGNGSTAWVLTRASDADTYALKSPNSLGGGDAFYVTSGNTGAGETYLCNNSGVISFGSTAISFVQISAAQVYSAGNGLSLTNTVFSLATPVAVANGGTGTTATPTNGQLLIGNGSNYTLSTLTAGSGVSITNSAGSITLSATGLGGTVTAVTASGPLASSGGTAPNISIANTTGTGSVVLQSDAVIYSATITAAASASITTITGSSANITTVTGTNASYANGTFTSATVTTLSGTTVTYSSGTITNLAATSITVTNTPAFVGNGTLTMNVSGTGLSGSQTFTANQSGNATFTVTSNATSANTGSTIVARDASGNFSAGTITATLNGNASTATTASNVNNGTLTMNVSGTGLSGSQTFTANQSGNATFTVTSNATSANTASAIVARDASGNFSAGTVSVSQINVSATGARWDSNGDIYAYRSGGGSGVIFLNSAGNRYLYWDGGTYYLPGANLSINGQTALTAGNYNSYAPTLTGTGASGTWGIAISGNAASATTINSVAQNLGYALSGQNIFYGGQLGPQVLSQGGGAAAMSFHRPGAFAANFGIDTDNQFALGGWSFGSALGSLKVGSFGVGTTASGTAGEIRATNNVTAYYSDARLKDFKGKIDGALDKVSQLNGYYYTENAKAEEFGYNNKAMQVGVSAQEVQAVLPEIIAPAPFDMDAENKSKSGENYMTVRYERLVPLLIEAIKELKAEVEALKAAK